MTIILLEDDFWMAETVSDFLDAKGYLVRTFTTATELLACETLEGASLFLLDINVPDFDGFEVFGYLRRLDIDAPVIFISAQTGEKVQKRAFEMGCDDFIKKPFELFELELRIKKALGESAELRAIGSHLHYDLRAKELRRKAQPIHLRGKQRDVLKLLVQHCDRTVTYAMLQEAVWSEREVSLNTIATYMRDLNRVLGEYRIENVSKTGYRLRCR